VKKIAIYKEEYAILITERGEIKNEILKNA